jgi:BMFP domain-containing protein YqiC
MIDAKKIQELGQKITEKLPPLFGDFKKETEAVIHQLLQSFFAKLELVTREEFEVQRQVLAKTREKVDALERELNEKAKR